MISRTSMFSGMGITIQSNGSTTESSINNLTDSSSKRLNGRTLVDYTTRYLSGTLRNSEANLPYGRSIFQMRRLHLLLLSANETSAHSWIVDCHYSDCRSFRIKRAFPFRLLYESRRRASARAALYL